MQLFRFGSWVTVRIEPEDDEFDSQLQIVIPRGHHSGADLLKPILDTDVLAWSGGPRFCEPARGTGRSRGR